MEMLMILAMGRFRAAVRSDEGASLMQALSRISTNIKINSKTFILTIR
jgi:hypothetical protein